MALLLAPLPTHATSIDTSPVQARLLSGSTRFITQESPKSLTLYRVSDGQALHRFATGDWINGFDVTPDDRLVVVTFGNGGIGAWSIATGDKLWSRSAWGSGLGYTYDVSLARDGMSLVAADYEGTVLVLATDTGRTIQRIKHTSGMAMSACLVPDGSRGYFLDLGERLLAFDVATRAVRDTGLQGAWPVRCSSDGRYLLLRRDNSGRHENLKVVATASLTAVDVPAFDGLQAVRAIADGSFLVTARRRLPDDPNRIGVETVGVHIDPDHADASELWRGSWDDAGLDAVTAYDPASAIGISTDFELLTMVIDLRTGASRITIDNRGPDALRRAALVSGSPGPLPEVPRSARLRAGWIVFGSALLAAALILAWRWRSNQRRSGEVATTRE